MEPGVQQMKPSDIVKSDHLADLVCHDDQMTIWCDEVLGTLSINGFLRDDMTCDDLVDLRWHIKQEIKSVVASAFAHPEIIS